MEAGAAQRAKSLVSLFFSMCCLPFTREGDETPQQESGLKCITGLFFYGGFKKGKLYLPFL